MEEGKNPAFPYRFQEKYLDIFMKSPSVEINQEVV